MLSIIATALVPAFFVMGLGYFAGKEKIVDALHELEKTTAADRAT